MDTKKKNETRPKSRFKKIIRRKDRDNRQAIPVPDWEEVVPTPPTFVAGMEPLPPKFTSSSSVRVGSVLGALVGDAPLGGVVDGGGLSGVALSGSSCCRSPPANPARSAPRDRAPTHTNGK